MDTEHKPEPVVNGDTPTSNTLRVSGSSLGEIISTVSANPTPLSTS